MKRNITVIAMLSGVLCGELNAAEPASDSRLDEVARRGRQVMPFSLERTLHIFSKTQQGGLQQVIAKDPADDTQIKLIREHLGNIAKEFKQGDFADPARIHGDNMPGLAVLRNAEPGAIDIDYRELENGAEIEYRTTKPALIDAIHRWFDAQLSDHARHATDHHPHHQMHQGR
ncbi:aspartate carbamoyltransferase [Methylomarinum vadi]|uniref:aspartate carbamoyltransferase n=1 Tax=Methylomarinum vadi TaxID=438855 RepID=UPI001F2A6A90|nr:aspartate carbamoyltransferase [Methylomarinum vadi]